MHRHDGVVIAPLILAFPYRFWLWFLSKLRFRWFHPMPRLIQEAFDSGRACGEESEHTAHQTGACVKGQFAIKGKPVAS